MRRCPRTLVGILLLLASCVRQPVILGVDPSAQGAVVQPSGAGNARSVTANRTALIGRVTDSQGRVIARAHVQLFTLGQPVVEATASTDSAGVFTLVNVPSAAYRVTVRHIGFKPNSWVQAAGGGGPDRVAVVLREQDALLEPVWCTTDVRPGLIVEVRDSADGALAIEDVHATAQEGTYVDTLLVRTWDIRTGKGRSRSGVHERAGTYTVTVRKPGYREWVLSDVRLTRDECHVITRQLQVRLYPVR